MPEYRKDLILDEWVIIATERAKRPENFREEKVKIEKKEGGGICPFDRGNESMTPPVILSIDSRGMENAGGDDWLIRVVPNKFPALIPNASPFSKRYGVYMVMDGFGLHEVVIHSPQHVTNLSELSEFQINLITKVYARRINEIKKDTRIESVIIMLNQGKDAGASIEHSHSQIFALPLLPPVLTQELDGTRKYYQQNKRCAMCDIIKFEIQEDKRVIHQTEEFLMIQPFASRNPFETWIIPKRHNSNFENISPAEIDSLSYCLKILVDFFDAELNSPSFNYYIHTGPMHDFIEDHYHWHFELVPKLSIKAGFEIATGVDICITTPEYTADFMKKFFLPL